MSKPAVAQMPSLGRIVLVRTRETINGQDEHAAIITQVFDEGRINVLLMPGGGTPYPIGSIYPEGRAFGSVHWRWPPRT